MFHYLLNAHVLVKSALADKKPMWITECGYNSKNVAVGERKDKSSPQMQALFFQEAYNEAVGLNVQKMFWLLLKDRNEPFFGTMGIYNKQGFKRDSIYSTIIKINK